MQGQTLGPYKIDRELGSGGMGKVYAATAGESARAIAPGSTVALKVVHPHLLEQPGFLTRFQREARLGASIRHPNVVRTLSCDEFDGTHVMVMEYVRGQTLSSLRRELERVPEDLCRHVGREICKGLAAIHGAGVVHRDLKPENVLITPDDVVKIMDLGVAKLVDAQMQLSQTGAFIGSVEYAAPEQFKGGEIDHRTDLHALGLVLYELATGLHPFRGGSFHEVLQRVCKEDARPLGQIDPQLSAFFEEVVHTLLVKDPRGRFASASQLLAALDAGEDSTWWHERAREIQATTKRPIRRIRIPRETAVYGREAEIATLQGAYQRAKAGDGQVVLIEGEAGIGKSRLVDELMARLQADGEDVNFLFGGYPPGGAATAHGGFAAAFREHFGEDGCAAYLPENGVLVPAFDALLRGEGAPEGAQALTSASLETCFVRASQTLAAERVTVLLVDDLHFAPDEGRALFASVAMAVPGHRVLVIGTTRPGVSEEWRAGLTRLPQTTHAPLRRLGPKDLMGLLRDSFKSTALADSLGVQIAIKSDGNPFFVFEIIRGLREGQFIAKNADGSWASTRVIDEIEIPSSVLDLVNARVSGLSQDERDMLDVAACWGYEFDPALIAEVTGIARIPLYKQLAQIERAHRLVRSSGRRFVFDHHQVQEALYESLPEVLREEYHGALAEALETRAKAADKEPGSLDGDLCVDLCEHFLKGARGEDAVRYLHAALDHLASAYLYAQAAALMERALAVPGLLTGMERAEALLRHVDVLTPLGRRTREEECARELEALAEQVDDDRMRGEAARRLGRVLVGTGRVEQAHAAFSRSLDFARACGDDEAEVMATNNLANVCMRASDSHELWERALELASAMGPRGRRMQVRVLNGLGSFLIVALHRESEGRVHVERALALSRDSGDRDAEARGARSLGNADWYRGRLHEALTLHQRALAIAREIGNRSLELSAQVLVAIDLSLLGRSREARQHIERGLVTARELHDQSTESALLLLLSRVAWDAEENSEALRFGEQALALCRPGGVRHIVAATLGDLGRRQRCVGDIVAARASLDEALELAEDAHRVDVSALTLAELACLPGGDVAAAEARIADAHEVGQGPRVHYVLWEASGDSAHLAEAKRWLDDALAKIPAEFHAGMLENVRINREVMAAWAAEFGEAPANEADEADNESNDDRGGTESITRAG